MNTLNDIKKSPAIANARRTVALKAHKGSKTDLALNAPVNKKGH